METFLNTLYMQLKDLERSPLDTPLSLALTKEDRDRWDAIQSELKTIQKSLNSKKILRMSDEARKRIIDLMDEAEAMIKDYKSKNLILPR